MKLKLCEIVDIKSGLVLNRKKAELSTQNKYEYFVVSLKSFNQEAIYEDKYADEFLSDEVLKDDFLIKKNDILFRLREPNYAVYINQNFDKLIYSSLMVRIRPKSDFVDSNFLAIYLNSDVVKKQLSGGAIAGTTIPMIKVADVYNIEIELPAIERQKKVVEYLSLSRQELQLTQKLIDEKSKLSKDIFKTLIKQG